MLQRETAPPQRRMRNRWICVVLVPTIIVSGLTSRAYRHVLPGFAGDYSGDALWTALVYTLLAVVRPGASSLGLMAASLAISYFVEFSQLWSTPWLDALRRTLPGRLVLGSTFNAPDLLAYAAGACIAGTVDAIVASAGRNASRSR